MNRKSIQKKILDLYREVYSVSTPPMDFDKLLKLSEKGEDINFSNYYIERDLERQIFEKHAKGVKKYVRNIMEFNYYLGVSPSSVEFYYIINNDIKADRIKWREDEEYFDIPVVGRSLYSMDLTTNRMSKISNPIIEVIEFDIMKDKCIVFDGEEVTIERVLI